MTTPSEQADAASNNGSGPLARLRIVESTAFIAAPIATMTLAQLGADVIRLDPPQGGLDYRRWPLAPSGASLYWTQLNRGKRSVTLDLRHEEAREEAARLICESGPQGGVFVTNLPMKGALSYPELRKRREDVIVLSLTGSPDGATGIDYTAHAASGVAMLTGEPGGDRPVSNVLPFWDLIAGKMLAIGLLAAERERRASGRGAFVELSLSDVAMASVANVGMLAEAELAGQARARDGNWVYGSFGCDFPTADGRYVMIVAVTEKQWRSLLDATGLAARMAHLAAAFEADLSREDERYRIRHAIGALIGDWTGRRSLADIREAFAGTGVCWGPFQDTAQLLAEDPRCGEAYGLFARRAHPGIPPVLTANTPLRFAGRPRTGAAAAPELGADTLAVLGARGSGNGQP